MIGEVAGVKKKINNVSLKISKRKNNLIYKENWLVPEKSDKAASNPCKINHGFQKRLLSIITRKEMAIHTYCQIEMTCLAIL